jgi:hypothetical protein
MSFSFKRSNNKLKSKIKKILIILVGLPIILFFIGETLFTIDYFRSRRTPTEVIIPDNYSGWVIVEQGVPDCPAIKEINEHLVYPIDAKGYYCTSSFSQDGWATDKYHYQSNDFELMQNPKTNLNRIWHEGHRQTTHQDTQRSFYFYYFYVGKYKFKKQDFEDQIDLIDIKIKKLIQDRQAKPIN